MKGNENMASSDFRQEIANLKKAIAIAWFMNFMVLALTIEAALIVLFIAVNSSNGEIAVFIAITGIISCVLSALITMKIKKGASKTLMGAVDGNMIRVNNGIVYDVVQEMAIAAKVKMPEVWIVLNSPISNAYAVSDKERNRIIITDRLLNMMTREELQGVVGHEIGHIASGDSEAMTTLVALTAFTAAISGMALRLTGNGYGSHRSQKKDNDSNSGSNPIALIIIIIAFLFLIIAPILAKITELYMSRTREFNADMMSVDYTRNPSALANALNKLAMDDGSINPDAAQSFNQKAGQLAFWIPRIKGLKSLNATHPPLEERISTLKGMGAVIRNDYGLSVADRMETPLQQNNQPQIQQYKQFQMNPTQSSNMNNPVQQPIRYGSNEPKPFRR